MGVTAVGKPNWTNRTLWTGDNLDIMRGMNSESVDLIYLDPPFNSNKTYSAPIGSEAAGAAFKDTWTLSDVDLAWHGEVADREPALYAVIDAAGQAHGRSMKSYLVMMAVRLLEMRRILRDTGSIYLHCDPTASHYLKTAMDCLFGKEQYRNEIVWHYGKMSNPGRNFPRNHDTILRYTKTGNYVFRLVKGAESEYRTRYARHLTGNRVLYGSVKDSRDKLILRRVKRLTKELNRDLRDDDVLFDFDREFKAQSDVMYVPIIKGNSSERIGYPTQKPLALLEKIVQASTNEGDMVLDPFCGCATASIAAERLGREWVGIDLSPMAAKLVKRRLRDYLGLFYDVVHREDIPNRTDLGDLPNYRTHKHGLFGQQEGMCAGCRELFPFRNFSIDHIVPRSKGGSDHIDNLQLLCAACNSSKGTRSQEEFVARLKEQGIRK